MLKEGATRGKIGDPAPDSGSGSDSVMTSPLLRNSAFQEAGKEVSDCVR
jgi:hypothetical protein